MSKATLIVSAVQFEVEPLLRSLEKEGFASDYYALGIGPLQAAYKARELEKLCSNKKVLYIGTCGSFANFDKPYLIQAKKTLWMPTGVRTGSSHALEKWNPPVSLKTNTALDLAEKTILTSPELSLTDSICDKVLKDYPREVLCENMELYAVAEALKSAKELNIILGVTNQVGPEGHEQWKTYFKEVSELTKNFVMSHKTMLL